jgi:glutamine amidotransferase
MTRVAIIDSRLCNLDSIARAAERLGASVAKARGPAELKDADRLILPGVGTFGAAMENLQAAGLVQAIRAEVAAGKPLLGICLGMQLLGETSEESPGAEGLKLIPGAVVRLDPSKGQGGERLPHMGWNVVDPMRPDPLLNDIAPGTDFYFVHSYRFRADDEADVVATTPYCGSFPSIIRRGTVAGVQFHPEKSQTAGFALLASFLGVAARAVA